MKKTELINLFAQLGKVMAELGAANEWKDVSSGLTESEYLKIQTVVNRQMIYNGWFTTDNVRKALSDWSKLLTKDEISNWLENYSFSEKPQKIAVIMAGNLPLVGFHDFASIVLSGNIAVCKLSSEDNTLLPALLEIMVMWDPEFIKHFELSMGRMGEVDAIIATGSDNSVRHFEQYFGHLPHVFRKNRTSVAVLDGTETAEQMKALGDDIFTYFGLGCRNVSHLLLPEGYEFKNFFENMMEHKDIIYHKKYGNNYDYHKAIFLMNKHELLDNNFVLLKSSEDLHSPLSMVYHHTYANKAGVDAYLAKHEADIQVVIGKGYLPFGDAQNPGWMDYADNFDTMKWLSEI